MHNGILPYAMTRPPGRAGPNPLTLVLLFLSACQPDPGDRTPAADSGEAPAADADGDGIDSSVDCDDADPSVYPYAPEICDGKDNDCDGMTDDEDPWISDPTAWFADDDGDGFGDSASSLYACTQPSGHTADATDCDDADATVNPSAAEVCDGVDNDCDGLEDDADADVSDAVTWHADSDGDGFGDSATSLLACTQPGGYTSDSTDCDDTDHDINPDAAEVCDDGVDNDCDGEQSSCLLGTFSLGGADVKISGESSGDNAGYRVAFGGDINRDGIDDLLVSSPYADSKGGSDTGKAYILFGPVTADGSLSSADLIMMGVNDSDYAGFGLSHAGDMNGDGYDDLLVGAHEADAGWEDAGTAYLVMGPASGGSLVLDAATTTFLGELEGAHLGYAVSGDGDVNDDGHDDLLIGAHGSGSSGTKAGTVYVLHGPIISGCIDAADADYFLEGESSVDQTGKSVALTGDTDGDGYDDFLVGAPGDDDAGELAGAAYLVLGPAERSGNLADSDAKLLGGSARYYAGWSVSAAGDVNADGYADSMVGAPNASAGGGSYCGIIYLLHGPISNGSSSLSIAEASFVGESRHDYAGYQLSSAGDVDGDGGDDILVGSHMEDEGGSNAGCAYLVYGPSSGTLSLADAHVKLTGESADDEVGAVARAGDQNLDGLDDLLIGAPYDDDGGSNAGALYVVFGAVGI